MKVRFMHTGITVYDLQKASKFFEDTLGFEVTEKRNLNGDYLSNVLGKENLHSADIHVLTLPDFESLELVQYDLMAQGSSDSIFNQGACHIAFYVEDLDAKIQKFCAEGASILGRDNVVVPRGPNAGRRIIFFKTPFGVNIELIER
jgi:catechol 2,3-dioxygenase-like lactoylglutathione lyase family enzyme